MHAGCMQAMAALSCSSTNCAKSTVAMDGSTALMRSIADRAGVYYVVSACPVAKLGMADWYGQVCVHK